MPDIIYSDFSYLQPHTSFTSREDFWIEVIEQLDKDFAQKLSVPLLAISHQPSAILNGEQVAEIIIKDLEKELPSFTPQLSEILYRVDVSEKQVESLNQMPGDIYYRCLAEIILQRTILKIITRKVYSKAI